MSVTLSQHNIVFFYDQPLVALSEDQAGLKYISLLVNQDSVWLACLVTPADYKDFTEAGKDLLSIMNNPQTEFGTFTSDYLIKEEDYVATKIVRSEIPLDWFPGANFKLNPKVL